MKIPAHKHSPLWLFDLDNTLHNASHAILPAITANMNRFMAQVLGDGVTPADAATINAVRQLYWRRYGATLLGMVKHHAVRAEDFLAEAHRFEDLAAMVRAERGLRQLLERLPGRKILLTNAPRLYSAQMLRHLGLRRQFAGHVAIESMRVHGSLRPKPSPLMLRRLLAREGVAAQRCILVEDMLSTLRSAKRLGLNTVWVTQYLHGGPNRPGPIETFTPGTFIKRPAYVNVKVKSVRKLPDFLHRLR